MKTKKLEVVHGSDNIFRDFSDKDADLLHLKARLAAAILGVLDDHGLSVRKAESLTGFAAADFSRVRNANIRRFTVDRLMTMLNRLGFEVDVSFSVRPHKQSANKANRAAA